MKSYDQMAKEMTNFLNTMDDENIDNFITEMSFQHRTLQQKFAVLCYKFIIKQSNQFEIGQYDLRNEASVKMSHEIVDFMEKNDMIYNNNVMIPFI